MRAQRKRPFLAVVDGAAVAPPAKPARRPRKTDAEREAAAIAAGETIARLLPAYVELHRTWAIGVKETRAYCEANFAAEELRKGSGPGYDAHRRLWASTGTNAAQRAMTALWRDIARPARIIAAAPAATLAGLRAKTLAAMWECMPSIADRAGFDFDEHDAFEKLFRACVRVTGLSELAASLGGRLGEGGAS